jgi:putative endonuclease
MAEAWAQAFLLQQGYHLLSRNFRTKVGEIDLIMHNRHSLVFVEVRLKARVQFGTAVESVNFAKQRRIVRASELFLQRSRLPDFKNYRFDIICFNLQSQCSRYQSEGQYFSLQWVQNAFESCT